MKRFNKRPPLIMKYDCCHSGYLSLEWRHTDQLKWRVSSPNMSLVSLLRPRGTNTSCFTCVWSETPPDVNFHPQLSGFSLSAEASGGSVWGGGGLRETCSPGVWVNCMCQSINQPTTRSWTLGNTDADHVLHYTFSTFLCWFTLFIWKLY